MKKRLSFLAMALLAVLTASAQMIAYDVQTTTSDYADVTGATVVDLQGSVGSDFSGLLFDNDGNASFNAAEDVTAFPIGFDFAYNGKQMKYFLIGSDGEILLSDVETVSTNIHVTAKGNGANLIGTNNNYENYFGIGMRNGFYGYDDTEISYKTEGDAGNRVLVIQYKNVGLTTASYSSARDEVAKAQLQYRLYEATGNISIHVNGWKPEDGTDVGSYNFVKAGIIGDKGDRLLLADYEGQTTTRDAQLKYSATEYPADGTVWTFVAPEPCETPAVAPSELALASTSQQINGTFTVGDADYYLVLATTADALSETPVDKTKYALNQVVGNATVIAVVEAGEFASPQTYANLLTPGSVYNVFVYGYNSKCANGPLYNATPATASIATKPDAPEALSVVSTDKTSITVSVKAAGTAPVLVAISEVQAVNSANQHLTNGVFGDPEGTFQVGEEIPGGGEVIYTGESSDAITVNNLTPGKPYFFRAWSADGNGAYSTLYLDINEVTAAELPWELVIDDNLVVGDEYLGWHYGSENEVWSDNTRNGYIYNQLNAAYVDEVNGGKAYYESPYIYLAEGKNRIKVGVAGTAGSGWMSGAWTLAENDSIVFQVTKDGVEYKNILAITKDELPSTSTGNFTSFSASFDEYAGEKVRLRLYIHRYSAGQTQFNRIYIEEKPAVDYPEDIQATVDGSSAVIAWTAQEGATSYDVSYKQANEEEWSEPQNVTEPSATLNDLKGLTKYEVRVRSVAAGSTSGWSDAVTFATGAFVPFEFVVNEADDLTIWSTYSGELSESTTLEEGGDFSISTGGWFGKNIRFMPYGTTTNSWLVSPAIAVGSDATKKFSAPLTLTPLGLGADELTVKVVVAKDGENFSSNNVIGTIAQSEMSEDGSKDYSFELTGFTGNIRLGYYVEGAGEDLGYLQFDKMGLLEAEEPVVAIQSVSSTKQEQNAIFNLAGQRVEKATKGLYIMNGKKVVVK